MTDLYINLATDSITLNSCCLVSQRLVQLTTSRPPPDGVTGWKWRKFNFKLTSAIVTTATTTNTPNKRFKFPWSKASHFYLLEGFSRNSNLIWFYSLTSTCIIRDRTGGRLSFHWDYVILGYGDNRHMRKVSLCSLFSYFLVISAWPAGIWSLPTWGWDFGYRCRSCTLCPVPSITATRATPTLSEPLIAPPPAISPPCHDCQCGLPSLPQGQEAVATSSSATSGWPALLPDC